MPKGRHKGARRQFTDFEAEAMRKEREEKEATWRARRGELPSDEEKEGSGSGSANESESSESESESSEGEEEPVKVPKAKGVSGLIEVENPNRQAGKSIKASQLDPNAPPVKPELTRREREEVQKQRDAAHYRKLHAAGKTDEARADLERLAIIKQKRAEAEQKRKEQQEAKDAAAASKKESLAKASGKKKS